MVFFHGGLFLAGSASTLSPKYFMDENVVVVTVNYRLGALGNLLALYSIIYKLPMNI
jgi:carboxylesterase type B